MLIRPDVCTTPPVEAVKETEPAAAVVRFPARVIWLALRLIVPAGSLAVMAPFWLMAPPVERMLMAPAVLVTAPSRVMAPELCIRMAPPAVRLPKALTPPTSGRVITPPALAENWPPTTKWPELV